MANIAKYVVNEEATDGNKHEVEQIGTHSVNIDNENDQTSRNGDNKDDNHDMDDIDSTTKSVNNDGAKSDWEESNFESSVSTTQFMKQNTLIQQSKGWKYITQMVGSKSSLLLYGMITVAIAGILVRQTLSHNSVAALFLDIFMRIHQGAILFVAWYYYQPNRFSKRSMVLMACIGLFFYLIWHVINFSIDADNYYINRVYDATVQSATMWRCQMTYSTLAFQVALPFLYRKHPLSQENSDYCLPYSLYVITAGISFVIWFVTLGNTGIVTIGFLFQITLLCTMILIQTKRQDSGKDKIDRNHGWMCFLAFGSNALGVGIGAALLSMMATATSSLVQCIIWFIWAILISAMLRMFIKMAEWSVPEHNRSIFMFTIIFADDFFSELVFALIEPFSVMFFVLLIFTTIRNITRDVGGFDWIIRRITFCFGSLKEEYNHMKQFSSISELSLFSELLAVCVVNVWAITFFIFEASGILPETMTIAEHGKLIGSYLLIAAMTIPQDKIVRHLRERNMMKIEKKLLHIQKHHPERQLSVELINRADYLSQNLIPWDMATPFLIAQIGFVVLYGISKLYIAIETQTTAQE